MEVAGATTIIIIIINVESVLNLMSCDIGDYSIGKILSNRCVPEPANGATGSQNRRGDSISKVRNNAPISINIASKIMIKSKYLTSFHFDLWRM